MISQQKHRVISDFPNVAYNVVAIAASRGGLKAISQIVSALPPGFPAAIIVVQHLSPQFPSYMAEILSKRTALQVKQAEQGDVLRPGTVYIAVPGKHLLVNPNGTLSLSDAPKMNFVRPAADKMFASVAANFQGRVFAVVLTGGDGDGGLGVIAIKKSGGIIIAQDEASCECFSMPQSAINTGTVDFVLPLDAIANQLISLVITEKVA
ncbi:CheB methylesterase [Scytonema sp. HK-05]|uniref:chemotaxis protein CheB n=1 Tax=Scytonema sp. HK-05 TaxID=1137095 RepID=UPI00093768B3|nr:chemotaxis protein CheB [Scytonema sp. HK-05]OKH45792.1 chemotaxis protein CheB [Scytonema sp. HK-05]BAY44868.1 CheB methylesterase [Scytonema sp. HK-05]